jgi:hypothetical protein
VEKRGRMAWPRMSRQEKVDADVMLLWETAACMNCASSRDSRREVNVSLTDTWRLVDFRAFARRRSVPLLGRPCRTTGVACDDVHAWFTDAPQGEGGACGSATASSFLLDLPGTARLSNMAVRLDWLLPQHWKPALP